MSTCLNIEAGVLNLYSNKIEKTEIDGVFRKL